MTTLALLDDLAQVEAVVRASRAAEQGDWLNVAMMEPSVCAALTRRGLPVHTTLPYFATQSHARLLEASQTMIEWVRTHAPRLEASSGIREAALEALVFWLRPALHYCLAVIEIAMNAVEQHRPRTLSAVVRPRRRSHALWFTPQERVLGFLAQRLADHEGLAFHALSCAAVSGRPPDPSSLMPASSLMAFLLRHARFLHWQRRTLNVRKQHHGEFALLTTEAYQMSRLAMRLQAERPTLRLATLGGPVVASSPLPGVVMRALWGKRAGAMRAHRRQLYALSRVIAGEQERFTYRGILFADVLARKLRERLVDHVIGVCGWSATLDRSLSCLRPDVVFSCGNRDDELVLAELCQRQGIPTVFSSHGSHVSPKNEWERIEWREHGRALLSAPFSKLALSSPLAEGYLETFPSAGRLVRTGPLLWGGPLDPERSRAAHIRLLGADALGRSRRIIVHAGTPKPLPRLRLYVYETPDEYLQAVRDLAEATEQMPDAVLLVAFRPTPAIGVEDMKALVPWSERVHLVVDEPFRDLLGMADLLVSYSSTTIEEALQNRIPVLLYGGGGRYQHVQAREVRPGLPLEPAATYHVRAAQELSDALRRILSLAQRTEERDRLFDPYVYASEIRTPVRELIAA